MEVLTLLGLAMYFLVCTAVGFRLVRMARRTGEAPELLVGAAFLSAGTIGYVLVAASALMQVSSPGWSRLLYFIGMPFISLGSVCLYRFWQKLYHPAQLWAKGVVGAAAAILVTSLVGQWWTTEVGSFVSDSPLYLVVLTTQTLAYAVNVVANGRFYRVLRRRLALGLAEPTVANRVFLWAFASAVTCAQYSYAGIITVMTPVGQPPVADPGVMSAFGMFGAAAVVLAFFPPQAYRCFLCERAASADEA